MKINEIADEIEKLKKRANDSQFFNQFLKEQKKEDNVDVLKLLLNKEYLWYITKLNPDQIRILMFYYRIYRIQEFNESSEKLDWELMRFYGMLKTSLNNLRSDQIIEGMTNLNEVKKEEMLIKQRGEYNEGIKRN